MQNNFKYIFCISALAILGLGGCSSLLTSPSSTSTTSGSVPTAGSSFTYQVRQYEIDDLTVMSTDTETATVTGTQALWNGQQNVLQFDNGDAFVYDSNGDVTVYLSETQPFNGGSQWVRFPFSGDAGSSVTFFTGDSVNDVMSTKYVTSGGSPKFNGKSYKVGEAQAIDTTTKKTSFGGMAMYSQYLDYTYAAQIGAMTEIDIGPFINAVTGNQTGKGVKTLIGFTIK